MKKILTYITLILVFVLQSTLCRYIEILHTIPNLLLVFVVCYCMHAEPVKATVLAGVAGLIMDVSISKHLGVNTLMMMYLGLLLSYISADYIRTNFLTVLVLTALSTLLYEGIYGFLLYFMFGKVSASVMFTIISLEAVYNTIIACIFAWLGRYLAYDEVRSF